MWQPDALFKNDILALSNWRLKSENEHELINLTSEDANVSTSTRSVMEVLFSYLELLRTYYESNAPHENILYHIEKIDSLLKTKDIIDNIAWDFSYEGCNIFSYTSQFLQPFRDQIYYLLITAACHQELVMHDFNGYYIWALPVMKYITRGECYNGMILQILKIIEETDSNSINNNAELLLEHIVGEPNHILDLVSLGGNIELIAHKFYADLEAKEVMLNSDMDLIKAILFLLGQKEKGNQVVELDTIIKSYLPYVYYLASGIASRAYVEGMNCKYLIDMLIMENSKFKVLFHPKNVSKFRYATSEGIKIKELIDLDTEVLELLTTEEVRKLYIEGLESDLSKQKYKVNFKYLLKTFSTSNARKLLSQGVPISDILLLAI